MEIFYFCFLFFVVFCAQMSLGVLDDLRLKSCFENSKDCQRNVSVINWNKPLCWCIDEILKEANLSALAFDKPQVLCRTPSGLTFQWTSSLHRTDEEFLISLREKDNKINRRLALTNACLISIEGLHPKTSYQIQVQSISQDFKINSKIVGLWETTLHEGYEPGDIVNISTTWLDRSGNAINASLFWEPAEDKSCHYDVILAHKLDSVTFHIRQPEDLFHIKLKNLHYSTNYTIAIIPKFESSTGRGTIHNLNTPSCLEANDYKLDICPPEKLQNLQIEERTTKGEVFGTYDVLVSWQLPSQVPDSISVILDTKKKKKTEDFVQNVPGNTTNVLFKNIQLGLEYRIKAWATSPAGHGPAVLEYRKMSQEELQRVQTKHLSDVRENYFQIILYVSIALLATLVGATSLILHFNKKKKISDLNKENFFAEKMINKEPDIELSYQETNNDSDEFEIDSRCLFLQNELLGQGAFGIVRKGLLKTKDDSIEVAIKMLRELPSMEEQEQFRQEMDILKTVGKHPHIVSLVGCCTRTGDRDMLVVEYCANGDLHTYLEEARIKMKAHPARNSHLKMTHHSYENTSKPDFVINEMYEEADLDHVETGHIEDLTAVDLLSFARQITLGMEFLASNRVVHRDLAARNVLLSADRRIKIADFGLSRDMYERNFYVKKGDGKLPIKWMALESLLYHKYTTQSDV